MSLYVLDPGHGGADSGTCHNGIVETLFGYRVCEGAANVLRARGHSVLFTHVPTEDPSHHDRAQLAVDVDAVGTISVHVNSGAAGEHGPLAFYNAGDVAGMRAAKTMIRGLNRRGCYVDSRSRRVWTMQSQVHVPHPAEWTRRVWYCIEQHRRSVALLECEYCSDAESARWLRNNVTLLAETVADGAEALG